MEKVFFLFSDYGPETNSPERVWIGISFLVILLLILAAKDNQPSSSNKQKKEEKK